MCSGIKLIEVWKVHSHKIHIHPIIYTPILIHVHNERRFVDNDLTMTSPLITCMFTLLFSPKTK